MIASPALVDASAILARKLILRAWLRCRAVMQSHILIGTVDAIRIAIAQPLLGNALRSSPGLVLLAGKFGFGIALAVV